MKTKEVAELLCVNKQTVINWCRKNNIKREMTFNGMMEYVMNEDDIENFKNRTPQGRPKKQA